MKILGYKKSGRMNSRMSRRWGAYLYLLCALCCFAGLAMAKVEPALELKADRGEYDIVPFAAYYLGQNNELTAEQILAMEKGSVWGGFEVAQLNRHAASGRWFRFNLKNLSPRAQWYFVVDYSAIRELDLYFVKDGEIRKVFQLGDQFEFEARLVQHRNFVIPFEIQMNEGLTVLTKVVSPSLIQFPAMIIDHSAYLQREVRHGILHGVFFGFLLVLAFYNFSNYANYREFSYLYYVGFALSIGLFKVAYEGFGFQFLWATNVWLQHRIIGISACMSLIFAALFVIEFLRLRCDYRLLNAIYRGFIGIVSLWFVMAFIVDESYVQQVSAYLTVFGCLLNSGVGLVFWLRGRRGVRYFAIGWIMFSFALISLWAIDLGLIQGTLLPNFSVELGVALGLALLAYALGRRSTLELKERTFQNERIREQEKIMLREKERGFELEKASNERLERSIQARTQELHKTLTELTLVNHRLEELNTHDNITGLRNANAYEERIQHEWERGIRDQAPLSLIVASIDGFDTIADRYGFVAAEESLKAIVKLIKTVVTRPADLVSRIGPAEFGFVLPNTEAVGALHIARALLLEVSKNPINLGICSIPVSLSIGVATAIPKDDENFMTFMERAEDTMLDAIELGGSQVFVRK